MYDFLLVIIELFFR